MDNNNAKENRELLSIQNLNVEYTLDGQRIYAVNNASLSLNKGETLGLVGETGAGKTTIAKSICRVLPAASAVVRSGSIVLDGENLFDIPEKKMQSIRGKKVSMIFQDPMTALNPVFSVGEQIEEVISLHEHVSGKEARKKAGDMLELVGIPRERASEYPFQFSGGMKQRVVIAMALACNPELLIADEPTTALDVTIQAQVLDVIKELRNKYKTSVLLITHDLGVVAELCDKVAVIYFGEIVEHGTLEDIFDHPLHPYTKGLFASLPKIGDPTERLKPIPGMTPVPTKLPDACFFCPRCECAAGACSEQHPELRQVTETHWVRCLECHV
ncbi:MAG: ABC transporter ATP-binding protein [Anaerolineaceae bacterium]|nr:ABC transporter ATP-binding protein [Anaerolineaceae bacterium]